MTSPLHHRANAPPQSDAMQVLHCAAPDSARWLEARLAIPDIAAATHTFSIIGRKFRPEPVAVSFSDLPAPLGGWDAATTARLTLLFAFTWNHTVTEGLDRWVSDLFYKGDSQERIAVLRALAMLPSPERLRLIATDGVRSHVQPVFEAIACENPYPCGFFDDAAFNQLVMKAYFTDVPVRRVLGLQGRLNPELRRMALDYAAERRAAGRSTPGDLSLITSSPE